MDYHLNADVLSITKLANIFVKRQQEDYDNFIAITGYEGRGKSTLALRLANKTASLNNTSFKVKENIVFNDKELNNALDTLQKESVIQVDEAISMLYKRDWNSSINKTLIKRFAKIRKNRFTIFFLIPSFNDIDYQLRNHRVFMWIHVVARGLAAVFIKSENPFSNDPWNLSSNEREVEKKYKPKDGIQNLISALEGLENFIGWIQFDKLETKMWHEYVEYADYKKQEYEEQGEDEMSKTEKKRLIQMATAAKNLVERGYTQKEVAEIFGVDRTTVNKWIRDVLKSEATSSA